MIYVQKKSIHHTWVGGQGLGRQGEMGQMKRDRGKGEMGGRRI